MDTQNNEYYATADMPQKSPLTEEEKRQVQDFFNGLKGDMPRIRTDSR